MNAMQKCHIMSGNVWIKGWINVYLNECNAKMSYNVRKRMN